MCKASMLAGLGNSLTFATLGIYFTLLSKRFSAIKNIPFINAQTMFFGWFGFIFFFSKRIYLITKIKN